MTEVDGISSSWRPQTAGIRQGCPLSPYLFIIVMNMLFRDVQLRIDEAGVLGDRIQGADFDHVACADDAICFTEDEQAMNTMLRIIEQEGAALGRRLNKKKCELLIGGKRELDHPITFSDGRRIELVREAKLLPQKGHGWGQRTRTEQKNYRLHVHT